MLNVLAVLTCTAEASEIEFQMTENSEMKNLKATQSTRETAKLHQQYNEEQDLIRDEMKELGDRTSDEYLELSAELRESQTKEDDQVKKVEEEAKAYEEKIDLQNRHKHLEKFGTLKKVSKRELTTMLKRLDTSKTRFS